MLVLTSSINGLLFSTILDLTKRGLCSKPHALEGSMPSMFQRLHLDHSSDPQVPKISFQRPIEICFQIHICLSLRPTFPKCSYHEAQGQSRRLFGICENVGENWTYSLKCLKMFSQDTLQVGQSCWWERKKPDLSGTGAGWPWPPCSIMITICS